MRRGPFALVAVALAFSSAAASPPQSSEGEGSILEMVGDVAVVATVPAGFAALSREQKALAWHLAQAALATHRVALMQNHRHDLAIWQLVEALQARSAALDPDFARRLADYRRRVFLHRGVHDAVTEEKLLPDFTAQELEEALRRSEAVGARRPVEPGLAELERTIFDPQVDPFRANRAPGPLRDPIAGYPEDKGILQQPPLLQVADQRRRRPVEAGAHVAVIAGDVFVRVPVAPREAVVRPAPDLHKADPALQQPPGNQAVAAEVLRDALVQPVHPVRGRGFPRDVEHFRGAQLQPGGQLVGGDSGVKARVAGAGLLVPAVHLPQ